MRTDIEFLEAFREDLIEAAWRESTRAPVLTRGRRGLRRRSGFSPRWMIATAAASSLVVAGLVGFVALQDSSRPRKLHAGDQQQALRHLAVIPSPAPAGSADSFFGYDKGERSDQSAGPSSPTQRIVRGEAALTRVIKTASLEVVVGHGIFKNAFQRATSIASRYGGFVQSSSTSGSESGTLLVRIPSPRFELALGDLRALGHVQFQSVTGRDVTSQFIDLRARLQIAQARRSTLLELLGRATTIGQTLQVQNVLDDTQLDIEQLQGQLRYLSRQTSFGTIRMTIREKGAPVSRHHRATPIHNPSFTRGLRHAVAGFLGVLVAVMVGLGYLIPIAVLAAVVWLAVRAVRRRRLA